MKNLLDLEKEHSGKIISLNGDQHFITRVTSIGLTPGCKVTILKNEKRRPLLVYSRDTMIALNRKECENSTVEETA